MPRPCSTRDDEVTKTQSITNDEVTKTQSVTKNTSDIRGYIIMPLPCSTQSVATLPVRGIGDHQDVKITETQSDTETMSNLRS